jgi:type VI secretion system secreted protein VgrG
MGFMLVAWPALTRAQLLGSAENFAVLAGSTVTNTGPTSLWGDLGVWPGTAITGFGPIDGGPGIVHGTTYPGGSVAQQAQSDLTTAYNAIASESSTANLSGQDLGGMTLGAGVYHFDSSAFLTGELTLDAQGDPNARFDFQIGSTLISASSSSVHIIHGGNGAHVYWDVGSSATLGTNTSFAGHLLATESITLNTGAAIFEGNALARNGAVTLDSNSISISASPVPEPTTLLIVGAGMAVFSRRRPKSA